MLAETKQLQKLAGCEEAEATEDVVLQALGCTDNIQREFLLRAGAWALLGLDNVHALRLIYPLRNPVLTRAQRRSSTTVVQTRNPRPHMPERKTLESGRALIFSSALEVPDSHFPTTVSIRAISQASLLVLSAAEDFSSDSNKSCVLFPHLHPLPRP